MFCVKIHICIQHAALSWGTLHSLNICSFFWNTPSNVLAIEGPSVFLHSIKPLVQSSCPCSADDAFLSSTKSNALLMLAPMLPPSATTSPSYVFLSLSATVSQGWLGIVNRRSTPSFRGNGGKQSTLTQKPSGATSILIFLVRHTYLYIGLH